MAQNRPRPKLAKMPGKARVLARRTGFSGLFGIVPDQSVARAARPECPGKPGNAGVRARRHASGRPGRPWRVEAGSRGGPMPRFADVLQKSSPARARRSRPVAAPPMFTTTAMFMNVHES